MLRHLSPPNPPSRRPGQPPRATSSPQRRPQQTSTRHLPSPRPTSPRPAEPISGTRRPGSPPPRRAPPAPERLPLDPTWIGREPERCSSLAAPASPPAGAVDCRRLRSSAPPPCLVSSRSPSLSHVPGSLSPAGNTCGPPRRPWSSVAGRFRRRPTRSGRPSTSPPRTLLPSPSPPAASSSNEQVARPAPARVDRASSAWASGLQGPAPARSGLPGLLRSS